MNYDNTNRGALFTADKQGNDRRPDYTGTLNVAGTDYQIAAWLKSSKAGQKYMSLSVQPARARNDDRQEERAPGRPAANPDFDADFPF